MPTVMIAEDDLLIADMLEEVLTDNGYDVCGIARTVDKAVELGGRYKPDLAILDIRLADGGLGTDIPARLKTQGRMGVLYASGHAGQMSLSTTDGDALLFKPYRSEDVVRALKVVEHIVSVDEAARQFPKGFSVLNPSSRVNTVDAEVDFVLTSQKISRFRRQQAELARFGTFSLGEHGLETVLAEAACVSAKGLGMAYSTIYRYRPEANDFVIESGFGWKEGIIGTVLSRTDDSSPQGSALMNRRPEVCADLSKDRTFVRPSHYKEYGITSTLDVVIGHGRHPDRLPYGVLELNGILGRDYDLHEIDFVTGVANIVALKVEIARGNTAVRVAGERLRDLDEDENSFLGAKNGHLGEKNRLLKRLLDQVSGRAMLQSDHGW